jgi:alkanesulfonate monooxygenase SsuD/methylene tetrahydromethanopterin reductase-like flavin-dependent oxidoreductase (luciferase family)
VPLSALPHMVERIREGERAAGKEAGSGDVICRFFCIPQPPEEGMGIARFLLSAYATVPVYEAFFRAHGWGGALDPMVDAWREGDRKLALERAPEALSREIVIFGTPEEQRARLEEFTAGGITTPVLTFLGAPDRLPGWIDALAP